MFTIISMAIAIAVAVVGYMQARSFVQSKLRFVDAVHHFAAPLLAGLAAMLIATPVVWLLPLIGQDRDPLRPRRRRRCLVRTPEIRKQIGSGTVCSVLGGRCSVIVHRPPSRHRTA